VFFSRAVLQRLVYEAYFIPPFFPVHYYTHKIYAHAVRCLQISPPFSPVHYYTRKMYIRERR
jgi:hypothetical protein